MPNTEGFAHHPETGVFGVMLTSFPPISPIWASQARSRIDCETIISPAYRLFLNARETELPSGLYTRRAVIFEVNPSMGDLSKLPPVFSEEDDSD